jgi:hypothetical protein
MDESKNFMLNESQRLNTIWFLLCEILEKANEVPVGAAGRGIHKMQEKPL